MCRRTRNRWSARSAAIIAAACWFHKVSNILSALPKSAHPGARAALAEFYNAEDKRHAQAAAKTFTATFGVKFPTDSLSNAITGPNGPRTR